MSSATNRIMDEFAKLMTDAAGAAQGVRREAEAAVHAQAERWLNSLDVVRREEFEVMREMAVKALDENEALKKRIESLEAAVAKVSDSGKAEKPAARTTAKASDSSSDKAEKSARSEKAGKSEKVDPSTKAE